MSDIRVYAEQASVGRVADGGILGARATRDGALATVPWFQMLALEGAVFTTSSGATDQGYTDPGTSGAGGIDGTEFDYLMTVPSAVGIIPITIRVIPEAIGTIAAVDVLAIFGSGGVVAANSVAAVGRNMKFGGSNSTCTIATNADAAGTAMTTVRGTFFRSGGTHLTGSDGNNNIQDRVWSAVDGIGPVILGDTSPGAQLAIFMSAQASTGFVFHTYAELPRTALA